MKSEIDINSARKEKSPPNSPRQKVNPNISSISNNNISALQEEDNFLKDSFTSKTLAAVVEPPARPRLSKEYPQKNGSIQYEVPQITQRISLKKRLEHVLKSKLFESVILGLILIYTLLVLVNIVLDDCSDEENDAITQSLRVLKYVELGILVTFIMEILVKSCVYGIKGYFKDGWYIVDALIILITFALVIVDIALQDSRINGLHRVRGLFRLFRIFLLLRKANEMSRITKVKIRTTGIDLKTPVEKVLDLLETLKANTNDRTLIKEIEWAIEMVSTNKLYEPIIEVNDEKSNEKSDVNLWLKSYNTQTQPKEDPSMKTKPRLSRRMSLMPPTMCKTPSLPPSIIVPQEAIELLSKSVDLLEFDIMEFKRITKEDDLSFLMLYLFERHNFFELLNIEQETFIRFAKRIQSGYLPNPYHSSTHAADVLQTTNYLLTTGELLTKSELNNLEVASLFISASIHDYDHPGTNNTFHINTGSAFAIRYNDKAVLESHHVASVFTLLQNEKYNIFSKFSKDDYKIIRERIISVVLATDMANHFTDIAKLKARLAADFDLKQKDKKFAMELAVHAADISNPTKPWDTCKEWTMRVITEFWNQGDKERELGIPITYLCDRYTVNIAKSQLGFIDFVAAPLFGLLKEILPKIDISNMESNKNRWKDLVDFYEQELKELNEKKSITDGSKQQLI